MKTRLIAACALALAALVPVGTASADEGQELPPEVQKCLDVFPYGILLGQETDGPDLVCMAIGQYAPYELQAGDTYACSFTPCTPYRYEPIEPVVVDEPELELGEPGDVEAAVVATTSGGDSLSMARAVTTKTKVRVTFKRVAGAEGYYVKCGRLVAKRTSTTKALVKSGPGAKCKVRAYAGSERSPWTDPVRVKRR